jgi:hypothetical protein
VNLADAVGRHSPATEIPGVDPLLDGDMRLGFQLQIALPGVAAIVILQRPLNIDRVRIMTFDQVAVIAVH